MVFYEKQIQMHFSTCNPYSEIIKQAIAGVNTKGTIIRHFQKKSLFGTAKQGL